MITIQFKNKRMIILIAFTLMTSSLTGCTFSTSDTIDEETESIDTATVNDSTQEDEVEEQVENETVDESSNENFSLGKAIGSLTETLVDTVAVTQKSFEKEIQTIYDDDEKIVNNNFVCSSNHITLETDKNTLKDHCKLKGIISIWVIDTDKDKVIEVPYEFKAEEGRAKIVVVDGSKKVKTYAECISQTKKNNKKGTLKIALKAGENRFKVVGKNSEYTLEMNFPEGRSVGWNLDLD